MNLCVKLDNYQETFRFGFRMRVIFNRFQPNVNSPNNVYYSTAILNLKEISSLYVEIRYIGSMYIKMISPGIPLYIALMRYKDMIMVAKSKGSKLTNQLNTCSRVHFEDLVLSQLVKKLPVFYETRRLIVFTTAQCLSQYQTRTILSTPCQTSYFRYILIISSHLHLGLPGVLFPSRFPTKSERAILPSSICATCTNEGRE